MHVPNLAFKDRAVAEGFFEVYQYPLSEPENITLVYKDNNQIQYLGANVLARMVCLACYGKKLPVLKNIKASINLNSGTEIPKAVPLNKYDILFPGEPYQQRDVIEATEFSVSATTNLKNRQYVECVGIFEEPPPNPISDINYGTFYHFGLFLSAFTDIEEYLFAYKFVDAGISYPTDFGIKIKWRIYMDYEV